MSMVMADDENSDFVANDAEQKVIREPPQIRSADRALKAVRDGGRAAYPNGVMPEPKASPGVRMSS